MEKNKDKNDPKSLAMMVAAMSIFGTIGIFRRMIPLSSAWVAFFRGGIGSVFLLLFVLLTGKKAERKPEKRELILLSVSGAVIGVNWMFLFEAYNYTSVSVATLCYYMAPTIVVVISSLFFRENMTGIKAVCTAAALAGMVMVSGVADGSLPGGGDLKGILFGLSAAAMYASVVLMNKSTSGIDPYQKTVIQLSCATLVMIPYLIAEGGPAGAEWGASLIAFLLIVGIIHTGLSYALYFGSMDGLRTHTVALLSYIDPVTALILSAIILGERLTPLGIFGAVLILGSAVVSELRS